MNDLISRQQAIDALRGYLVEKRCPDDGTLTCRLIENEVINKLPSVQPERKTGHWVYRPEWSKYGDVWSCSECGEKTSQSVMGKPRFKYCPMCGAKMEEGREDG